MRSFRWIGNCSMPKQKVKGFQCNENKYCVSYQNRSLDWWSVNYIRSQARGITLGTGGVQESQVSILGPVGYGPTMWVKSRKGGLTSCTITIARHVREQHVSYVGNNVGTKGEGRREPFSCSLNEADQQAKFSSIGGYRNVINKSNRVLLTELYNEVFT